MSLLIGREGEIARLHTALSRVVSGEPGVLVLSGLPGAGKSRLAREGLDLAADAGFDTFIGHANELGADAAYAPFVEALGGYLRTIDDDTRHALVGDLPQLGLVFSGLRIPEPQPLGDPTLERTRLMDGFARLIERMARNRPLALAVDDAHAADSQTAMLLRHIALTVTDVPVLMILTAQLDGPDLHRLGALTSALAESQWWLDQIPVSGLGEAAAVDMFSQLIGGAIDENLRAMVIDQCAGRPLLLEAVARNLVEGGTLTRRGDRISLSRSDLPLPGDVKNQLGMRLHSLTDDEREATELLAAAGRDCEYGLLAAASSLDRERLTAALAQLEERMLVTSTDDATRFAMAHGLLRQTVLAQTPVIRQRRRHSDLAHAMARIDPADPRIIEQLLLAGSALPRGHVIPQLLDASRRARTLGSLDDAIRYLAAARDLARTAPVLPELAELTIDLGELCALAGHRRDALDHLNRGLALCTDQGDPISQSRAHRALAELAFSDGDATSAELHFAAAEHAQRNLEPSPDAAELAYARMVCATRVGDTATVARSAKQLRSLAARLRSPQLSIRALLAEAARDLNAQAFPAAQAKNQEALELAHSSEEPLLHARAYDQLSTVASIAGDLPELRRCSEASLEIVRRLGATSLEAWPRMRLAVADLMSGDWDRALLVTSDILADETRYGERRGRVSTLGVHAWLLALRGREADAEQYLRAAREIQQDMTEIESRSSHSVAAASTLVAMGAGRFAQTAEVGAPLADLHASWYPIEAAMVLGEALGRAGMADAARELSARVRQFAASGTGFADATAQWIDSFHEPPETAESSLTAAVGTFDRLGLRFHAAQARLQLAIRIEGSGHAERVALAQDSLAVFERLGAPRPAQEARHLLRDLGEVPSRGRARTQTGIALSSRELEVARHVASGHSNAQIATELFISPRTVTTHLDRIYHRLGLNSRAALTRYLADTGLLTETTPEDADTIT